MNFVKDILAKAQKAAGGEHIFNFIAGSEVHEARIQINADFERLSAIRAKASNYTYEPGALKNTPWAPWIGDGKSKHPDTGEVYSGIGAPLALRIAYAEGTKLSVRPAGTEEDFETISALDLLILARTAGGLFTLLTDEILQRVNGINLLAELEAVKEMGEDSPETTGD